MSPNSWETDHAERIRELETHVEHLQAERKETRNWIRALAIALMATALTAIWDKFGG